MDDDKHGTAGSPDPAKPDDGKAKTPGAGPHAKPELTNEEATPGAGSLPETGETGDDAGAG